MAVAILILVMIFERKGLSQDGVFLVLILITLLLGNVLSFFKDWLPVFLFFFCYEFIRGHLPEIQSVLHISVNYTALYNIDKAIFGSNIPVILAQKLIQSTPTIIDFIAFIWYTSTFWASFFAGYYFWLKNKKFFIKFRNRFALLCFLALLTFLVFPAAPPWMASQFGVLPPLITNTWGRLQIGSLTLGIFNIVGTNPVAPFPSLHIGWSVLIAYMLFKYFKPRLKKFAWLIYLYPLIMCFVITYTSDHYVIDMIGGVVYAAVSIAICNYFEKRHLLKQQHTEPTLNYLPEQSTP